MKKKIVITSSTSWYPFNFRLNTLLAMQESGYDVYVVAPDDLYFEKLKALGVSVIRVNLERGGVNPIKDLLSIIDFIKIFNKLKPDYIFNFTPKCNIYSTLAGRCFTKNIINNMSGLGTAFIRKNLTYYISYFLYMISQNLSKKVYFQNPDDLNFFVKKGLINEKKTGLLPGSGVDLERFKYVGTGSYSTVKFLFCGRFINSKGIRLFVNSAKTLLERYPEQLSFELLGFIDERDSSSISKSELEDWCKSGIVVYLGKTDNVAPYISSTNCIVLPSFYPEGTPKSLLEAASIGKPIITTDNIGCRDVVVDGKNGFLCQKESLASLVDAMERFFLLSQSEKLDMGQNSRKLAEEKFDERIVIKKYLDELN